MSVITKSIILSGILTAIGLPALAATEGRAHPDNLVVWIFLGLCALIVIAQVAPMVRNARNSAKLAANQAKAPEQTTSK